MGRILQFEKRRYSAIRRINACLDRCSLSLCKETYDKLMRDHYDDEIYLEFLADEFEDYLRQIGKSVPRDLH